VGVLSVWATSAVYAVKTPVFSSGLESANAVEVALTCTRPTSTSATAMYMKINPICPFIFIPDNLWKDIGKNIWQLYQNLANLTHIEEICQ
jgi:hypothetical protein